MSPRRYELGQRQAVIDESRRRVLDAARELLAGPGGYQAFTVDAVARRADVARATVYYQFRSKTGLLEALCDDLAGAGQMSDLPGAFAEADPRAAVHRLITVFAGFWAADRVVMRRLRALSALDPDVHAVLAARDDRRRQGLEVLIGRLTAGPPGGGPQDGGPHGWRGHPRCRAGPGPAAHLAFRRCGPGSAARGRGPGSAGPHQFRELRHHSRAGPAAGRRRAAGDRAGRRRAQPGPAAREVAGPGVTRRATSGDARDRASPAAPDIGGFITRHMTRRKRFQGVIPGSRVHAELP